MEKQDLKLTHFVGTSHNLYCQYWTDLSYRYLHTLWAAKREFKLFWDRITLFTKTDLNPTKAKECSIQKQQLLHKTVVWIGEQADPFHYTCVQKYHNIQLTYWLQLIW